MSLLLSSPAWFAGPARAQAAGWRFGHVTADEDGAAVLQWLQKRNCSVTPRQMLAFYASLCAVSLGIASVFALHGAPVVLLFAGLELLAVGLALLVFARHASDRETLTLRQRTLRVEQRVGPRTTCTDFTAEWLRVEPAGGQGSLVQLSGEGRSVSVGRHLRPELRAAFAGELRQALCQQAAAGTHEELS